MSGQIIFANTIMAIVLLFVLWCICYRPRDAKFAFLNIFRHRRRSFTTIAAIMLGGISLFLYGGFIDYSFWILKEQIVRTNIGHVQIYNQNYFETSNKVESLIDNYLSLKEGIINDDELSKDISALSGQLEFTGLISQYESGSSSYFSALGIEPLPALKLGSFDRLIYGSDLSQVKASEVTLGSGLAKTLSAQYDDWLDVLVVNSGGGQGALSMKLRGIFESGIKDYDDVAMKVPLNTAQRIMGTDGVSKIIILLKDDNSEAFSHRLRLFIAEHRLPLIVKTWKDISLFYQQVDGLLSGIYFFIKVIVSLVIVFMIGNAMTMSIIERTREITTLRAIGLKPLHVTRLFILEGVFIGIMGAAGSLTIGHLLAAIINLNGIAMPPSPGQSQGYTAFIKTDSPALNWITLVLPVLTAAVAALLPARRASKITITDAFKFS